MGHRHIEQAWNEHFAKLKEADIIARRNDPARIAANVKYEKERAAKEVKYQEWEKAEIAKRREEQQALAEEKENTEKLHTAKNEIIKAHINELFKTPEESDIKIQPYFSGAGVDKPTYYYHIDMRHDDQIIHMGVFKIPLTTAQDSNDVFPFLSSESELPIPVPLASSVNAILHGWLPILNAIRKTANWSHYPTIKNIDSEHTDPCTLRYIMQWEARYSGTRTLLEKNGLSYNDYNIKEIYITSWVEKAVPWFELRMPKHLNLKLREDYQQKYEVGNIQDLIAQLQSQFSVSNPLTDGFNAINNRAAQLAEALRRKK